MFDLHIPLRNNMQMKKLEVNGLKKTGKGLMCKNWVYGGQFKKEKNIGQSQEVPEMKASLSSLSP